MKAHVDKSGCISCGLCVSTCPNVFRFDSDEKAEAYVDTISSEDEPAASEARDGCPVSVITVE